MNNTRSLYLSYILVLCLLLSDFGVSHNAWGGRGEPRLEVPTVRARDRTIMISTRLKDAFSDSLLSTIHLGKRVSLSFHLAMFRQRTFFFPDERIWSGTVIRTVEYDPATRRYIVSFESTVEKEKHYTEQQEKMENLFGVLDWPIPVVFNRKTRKKEYYVKVWAEVKTVPLPGSFKTAAIYSKTFRPIDLNVLIPVKKKSE